MIARRLVLQGFGVSAAAITFGASGAAGPLPEGLTADFIKRAQGLDQSLADLWNAFSLLKESFDARDPRGLWPLCTMPLLLVNKGARTLVTSEAGLIAVEHTVFAPRVRDAVLSAAFGSLFLNCFGAMIGDGELWIGNICRDPDCAGSGFLVSTIDLFD